MRSLTSYRIDPIQPLSRGPVFVLTSARSISAAEIAADALQAAGRATLIGEKTPGILLPDLRSPATLAARLRTIAADVDAGLSVPGTDSPRCTIRVATLSPE